MIEGRRTVAERAFVSEAVIMAQTNEDALESVVREHARLVYRIAYSVFRNHHDAEDVAQETFVRVLRYRKKLEAIRDPKTWIARIAWRVAVDRSKKRAEISRSEKQMAEAIAQVQSQLASAEENTSGSELAGLLSSMIAALPEPLRDALRLSTIDELSPREIANLLQTTEASVRSRLFRARQILKDKLGALEGNHGIPR
jgi:RNA polymerase sigma-70 factor, ECF subfamily